MSQELSQLPSHYATEHGHLAISAQEMEALGLDPATYIPLYKSPEKKRLDALMEISLAAKVYYDRYCQDEAEDDCEDVICSVQQCLDARALRDALKTHQDLFL